MRVLLLGGGAREHAIGWKLAQSDLVDEIVSAPGNPGLAEIGPTLPSLDIKDAGAVAAAAAGFDLVVVGPEDPLAAGVADAVAGAGVAVFGPTRAAARLESSKSFAKEVMRRAGVATAGSAVFSDAEAARAHLDDVASPYVVKADGLAAGKGVLVTSDIDDARAWVDRCFGGGFGAAGSSIIIEEFLSGPEVSVFAVCAGEDAAVLEPARDFKRLADGDAGPNTGGMGCFSPVPDTPEGFVEEVTKQVILPTLRQMKADGVPYSGFLYAGLVMTAEGPKIMEFNCRLGDPEAQVVLPRLESDLAELIVAGLEGSIGGVRLQWRPEMAVDVVLASEGYPESPRKGVPITGVDAANGVPDVIVFHAGTARRNGELVTAGGRVLNIVGIGSDAAAARARCYEAVSKVEFPGMQYRTDIAAGLP